MAEQTLTAMDAALKDDYSPGLRYSVNNKATVVLAEMQRNTKDIVGRKAVWSVHTRRSTSTGARAEVEDLPPAGHQEYDGPSQALKFMYHTSAISGPALELTQNTRGSFISAMSSETRGAERDLKNDVSRMLYGRFRAAGAATQTGVLADLATKAASLTLDLATTTLVSEMRAFFVGMYIDVIDESTGLPMTNGKARSINAVSFANKTITIDTAAVADVSGAGSGTLATTAATHYVARHGAYNDEFPGLRAMIDDGGAVHGLDQATEPLWAASEVGSSTTPLSESLLERAWDKIFTDGDGGSSEDLLVVMSTGQRRTLAERLQAQKVYEGREMTLTAGWKGLKWAHGVIVVDKYAPDDRAFLLNRDEINWFVGRDFGVDETDGRALLRTSKDSFEFRWKAYVCPGVLNRNSHAVVLLQTVTEQ